jgi:hypothetical protein
MGEILFSRELVGKADAGWREPFSLWTTGDDVINGTDVIGFKGVATIPLWKRHNQFLTIN